MGLPRTALGNSLSVGVITILAIGGATGATLILFALRPGPWR
jgi:hypothetical protein